MPMIFGVLTCITSEQDETRAGRKQMFLKIFLRHLIIL
jgi:6,7-dimethyl-8-ribityllumazine synthase